MLPDGKTIYQIRNEDAEVTTITLDKWAADALQQMEADVHAWVQKMYDRAGQRYPDLSRRARGDLVRAAACTTASKHLGYTLADL